jgi:hypothetical protein
VSKMATKASTALKVTSETSFKPLTAAPQVVEAVRPEEPLAHRKKLPLELRLKRQREIIHARRGELKRFLSPRQTPYGPVRSMFQMVGVQQKAPSARQKMLALEARLERQRMIIHARRGRLKHFLSPR